ncbi:MAG: transaldolase [Myxococcaceae bacterium]
MASLLEQLKQMTVVVADTGDFGSMTKFKPRDSTTNPSLIAAAAGQPAYAPLVDRAIEQAKKEKAGSPKEEVARRAIDRLCVVFGTEILKLIPGRVSTEVDARLSYDTEKSIAKARDLIGLYKEAGIAKERVLIKLASSWEGMRAAEVLEKDGIHCNMTLLFGFHQAVAAAEAKVTLISPFVGRILDWHLKATGKTSIPPPEDPGVISVTKIYNYYKRHGYPVEVMGASFRNLGEITELAGCDLLTIAPKLLAELESTQGNLPRKLDPANSKALGAEKISVDKATFDKMHAEDKMASDKLKEGVDGFVKAIEELEKTIQARL